jgi:membrane-associated phospholipid phosphatase
VAAALFAAVASRVVAFSSAGAAVDRTVLHAFVTLRGAASVPVATGVLGIVGPLGFAVCATVLVLAAYRLRSSAILGKVAAVLAGANLTTFAAKHFLHGVRPVPFLRHPISMHSWPSGHATAAMSLILAASLVTSRRERRWLEWLAVLALLAVACSLLILHWHFPSDIAGGFAVGIAWRGAIELGHPCGRAIPRKQA